MSYLCSMFINAVYAVYSILIMSYPVVRSRVEDESQRTQIT
jgi:hypothetical protein